MVGLKRRVSDDADGADLPFADADTLVHPIYDKEAVRTLLEAPRREAVVEIEYWSKKGSRVRRTSPHHLIFADGRYHVRVYCHEDLTYLDFVLPRVVTAHPVDEPWVSGKAVAVWHKRLDLVFRINPGLPESAREAIRLDYIPDGKDLLVIRAVREVLAFYVRRRLLRHNQRFDMPLWLAVPCYS